MAWIAVAAPLEQAESRTPRVRWLWLYSICMPFMLAFYVWSDDLDRSRMSTDALDGTIYLAGMLVVIPVALLLDRFGRTRMLVLDSLLLVLATPLVLGNPNSTEILFGRLLIFAASILGALAFSITLFDLLETMGTSKRFVRVLGAILGVQTLLTYFLAWPVAGALNESGHEDALFVVTVVAGAVAMLAISRLPANHNRAPIRLRMQTVARAISSNWRLVLAIFGAGVIADCLYFSCVGLHWSDFYFNFSRDERAGIGFGSYVMLVAGYFLAFLLRSGRAFFFPRMMIALLLIGGVFAGQLDAELGIVLYLGGYLAAGMIIPGLKANLLSSVPQDSRVIILALAFIVGTGFWVAFRSPLLDTTYGNRALAFGVIAAITAAFSFVLMPATAEQRGTEFEQAA
jgi:MFS family permease